MKAFLKSSDGLFVLKPKVTIIGRQEDSDIILKSLGVEDRHAALEFSDTENSFVLRDFNSTHGTYVNDCHIQNAAVRVSPGDRFRFGSSGTLYELVVENASQVSCPPLNRRSVLPGQLQIVTETEPRLATVSQFPFLQSPRSPPLSRSRSYVASGASPHPPIRKRPINAWGRTVSSFSPDSFSRPAAVSERKEEEEEEVWRQAGRGGAVASGPLTKTLQSDALLKEKDEVILKKGNETIRFSGFDSESNRKDIVIANLQKEIATLNEKMATALVQKDSEFHQKLVSLDQDVGAKAEEIKALKEQISNLQRNTSEVLYHSLSERDLQLAHWKHENESLKKSQSLTTGLVTSLQKDVTTKEQRVQELKLDAERLRRESREKDNQIAHLAAQQIQELELQVKRSDDEIQKCHAEQETLSRKLVEKVKSEVELIEECERRNQQLQEMGRRERLLKSDMEQTETQSQHFRSQIIEMLFSTLTEKPPSNQQIMLKIKHMQETNREHCQREKFLRDEVSLKNCEMKELSENIWLLKKSLDGVQVFLKTSFSSSSLRKEICNLQNLCLTPPAKQVRTSAAEVLGSLLSWVEAVERLLQDVGLDISGSDQGMMSYMKKLRDSYFNTTSRLQTLQSRIRTTEEAQNLLLKEKFSEVKEKLEEEFQRREKDFQKKVEEEFQKKERALLEQDQKKEKALLEQEEKRETLESMAALEKQLLKDTVEELKEKIQELEKEIQRLTEVIEEEKKSEEVLNTKLKDTLEKLAVADRNEDLAEEKLAGQEKRLKSLENEYAVQKQKHQTEITEYKEQIKQHSLTIVNLEQRLLEAVQQSRKVKEENVKLQKQIEEMLKESSKSLKSESEKELSRSESEKESSKTESQKEPPTSESQKEPPKSTHLQEIVSCTDGTHVFMKEELAAAKREILSHQAVIWELKKELSEARAKMSDMIGELNEKQKMELEQKRSLVLRQEHELNRLREKLSEISRSADQKDADFKTTSEELRKSREKLEHLKTEVKEKVDEPKKSVQDQSTQTKSPSQTDVSTTSGKGPILDLADLGARCKGSRHEETILRQKDALAELRKKIKILGRGSSFGEDAKMDEPLIILRKGLSESSDQKSEKESVFSSTATVVNSVTKSEVSSRDPNFTIERTARLEMSDALDLSESMYLNLIRDLASLVNVKELTGMQTVKYLPRDEREKIGIQRQKDLELLFDKLSKLKNRLRRKEELLEEYDKDVGQIRANQQTLKACRSEMARLADKIYREAEENALLKEDLRRTKWQLSQEKRVNRALNKRKNHVEEKRNEFSCCSCSPKFADKKTAVKKKSSTDSHQTIEKPTEDHARSESFSAHLGT